MIDARYVGDGKKYYLCDPDKNMTCEKTDCQTLCIYTTKKECSKDGKTYFFNPMTYRYKEWPKFD